MLLLIDRRHKHLCTALLNDHCTAGYLCLPLRKYTPQKLVKNQRKWKFSFHIHASKQCMIIQDLQTAKYVSLQNPKGYKRLTINKLGFCFFSPMNRMPPASPLGAGSRGEDHNESVPWVFLMNKPGTKWTATRIMCDLADCCHGEAALLSPSRGPLVLIIHT